MFFRKFLKNLGVSYCKKEEVTDESHAAHATLSIVTSSMGLSFPAHAAIVRDVSPKYTQFKRGLDSNLMCLSLYLCMAKGSLHEKSSFSMDFFCRGVDPPPHLESS